jgi:hypothetical protein
MVNVREANAVIYRYNECLIGHGIGGIVIPAQMAQLAKS